MPKNQIDNINNQNGGVINIHNSFNNWYLIALILFIAVVFLWDTFNTKDSISKKESSSLDYIEQDSGVTIVFSKDKKNWDKLISYGEAELTVGDRKDIRESVVKATLRAKANISKFIEINIKTESILKEISQKTENSESLINTISESSNSILKGVVISRYKIDKSKKILTVKATVTRGSINATNQIK